MIKEKRSPGNHLELEIVALPDRLHNGLQAPIVGSVCRDDADFFLFSYITRFHRSCISFGISFRALLPRILLNFSARISPVPGRFTQRFFILNFSPAFMGTIVTTDANAKSMVGFSSFKGPLRSPRDSQIAREPSRTIFSSAGSMETEISSPRHDRSDVKCRSRIEAPSATAPIAGHGPSEWFERPTTVSGNAFLNFVIA